MKVSKAQLKREKQLRSSVEAKINRILGEFKNEYFTDYKNYFIGVIEKDRKYYQSLVDEPKLLEEVNANRYKYKLLYESECIQMVKIQDSKLARRSLLEFNLYNEASEGFEKKKANLIEKVLGYEMKTTYLKVERVGSGTHNSFSILISNAEMEIEARFIYACGEIKAPHYRFIITKRNK